jgi:SAM-dependent methyltransferase
MWKEDIMSYSESKLNQMYKEGYYNYLCSNNFKKVYEYISNKIMLDNCSSVLEVGCWDGMFFRVLNDLGYDGEYLGFDLCSTAIEYAKKKYNNNSVNFIKHNWDNELEEGEFDAIYFGGIFCYISDKVNFINRYIKKHNPKIILIQDLQQTDFSDVDKHFDVDTTLFDIDIKINKARKERQVKFLKIKN